MQTGIQTDRQDRQDRHKTHTTREDELKSLSLAAINQSINQSFAAYPVTSLTSKSIQRPARLRSHLLHSATTRSTHPSNHPTTTL